MNDANPRRHYAEGGPDNETDPYSQDPYYQQQPYDYDEYGNPVAPHQRQPHQQPPQQGYPDAGYGVPQQAPPPYYEQYDPYDDTGQQQVYQPRGYPQGYPQGQQGQQGYDGYSTGQQPAYPAQDYGTGQMPAQGYGTGQMPAYGTGAGTGYIPAQQPGYQEPHQAGTGQDGAGRDGTGQEGAAGPGEPGGVEGTAAGAATDYRTEQFAFVDEESEESEEVIDWLKFSESRTERREEARRRGRSRKLSLVVIVVLALLGGGGYLWHAGKIPGLKKGSAAASSAGGPQQRDVIVVHMLPVDGGPSSTALLVDNATKKHGTTVLVPNNVELTDDDGTATTLDKSVADGVGPTRDSLNALLGTDIKGSWRLDSPYLELLVDSLGDIYVDTNAEVKGTGKTKNTVLVPKGEQEELSGQAAVAYATYRAPGEPQTAQLSRFGQVMEATLKKMPSDAPDATKTVAALAQILDPSLTEKQLGATLAELADLAKTGQYSTTTLPVNKNGSLDEKATAGIVKDVLGSSGVKQKNATAPARVSIKNATGVKKDASMAQAAIVNGGTYTYVAGGTAATQQVSQVLYADAAREAAAKDVALTLGLKTSAVKKGKVPSNADVSVVLGKDYQPSTDGD